MQEITEASKLSQKFPIKLGETNFIPIFVCANVEDGVFNAISFIYETWFFNASQYVLTTSMLSEQIDELIEKNKIKLNENKNNISGNLLKEATDTINILSNNGEIKLFEFNNIKQFNDNMIKNFFIPVFDKDNNQYIFLNNSKNNIKIDVKFYNDNFSESPSYIILNKESIECKIEIKDNSTDIEKHFYNTFKPFIESIFNNKKNNSDLAFQSIIDFINNELKFDLYFKKNYIFTKEELLSLFDHNNFGNRADDILKEFFIKKIKDKLNEYIKDHPEVKIDEINKINVNVDFFKNFNTNLMINNRNNNYLDMRNDKTIYYQKIEDKNVLIYIKNDMDINKFNNYAFFNTKFLVNGVKITFNLTNLSIEKNNIYNIDFTNIDVNNKDTFSLKIVNENNDIIYDYKKEKEQNQILDNDKLYSIVKSKITDHMMNNVFSNWINDTTDISEKFKNSFENDKKFIINDVIKEYNNSLINNSDKKSLDIQDLIINGNNNKKINYKIINNQVTFYITNIIIIVSLFQKKLLNIKFLKNNINISIKDIKVLKTDSNEIDIKTIDKNKLLHEFFFIHRFDFYFNMYINENNNIIKDFIKNILNRDDFNVKSLDSEYLLIIINRAIEAEKQNIVNHINVDVNKYLKKAIENYIKHIKNTKFLTNLISKKIKNYNSLLYKYIDYSISISNLDFNIENLSFSTQYNKNRELILDIVIEKIVFNKIVFKIENYALELKVEKDKDFVRNIQYDIDKEEEEQRKEEEKQRKKEEELQKKRKEEEQERKNKNELRNKYIDSFGHFNLRETKTDPKNLMPSVFKVRLTNHQLEKLGYVNYIKYNKLKISGVGEFDLYDDIEVPVFIKAIQLYPKYPNEAGKLLFDILEEYKKGNFNYSLREELEKIVSKFVKKITGPIMRFFNKITSIILFKNYNYFDKYKRIISSDVFGQSNPLLKPAVIVSINDIPEDFTFDNRVLRYLFINGWGNIFIDDPYNNNIYVIMRDIKYNFKSYEGYVNVLPYNIIGYIEKTKKYLTKNEVDDLLQNKILKSQILNKKIISLKNLNNVISNIKRG